MLAADGSLGALYIGQQVAILLFGATIVQTWMFAKHCGKDSIYLKLLVAIIMILGTVSASLTSAELYHSLVSSIGDPLALTSAQWTSRAVPFITTPIITAVQWFYGIRLFLLMRSYGLLSTILLLGLSPITLGIAGASIDMRRTIAGSSTLTKNISCASLVMMMICDTIITIAMVRYLRNHRTGIKSTRSMLASLTNYTLASGLITWVASCSVLVTFLALPHTQIYAAISFILPHLYTNSLLALLNARRSLRRMSEPDTSLAVDERAEVALPPFFAACKPLHETPTHRSGSGYLSTTMNIELSSLASPNANCILNIDTPLPDEDVDAKAESVAPTRVEHTL